MNRFTGDVDQSGRVTIEHGLGRLPDRVESRRIGGVDELWIESSDEEKVTFRTYNRACPHATTGQQVDFYWRAA